MKISQRLRTALRPEESKDFTVGTNGPGAGPSYAGRSYP
jgi:hypothetical protein